MSWFKCKHPFYALAVEKEVTEKIVDRDFINVDYHLFCQLCHECLTLYHAKPRKEVGTIYQKAMNPIAFKESEE